MIKPKFITLLLLVGLLSPSFVFSWGNASIGNYPIIRSESLERLDSCDTSIRRLEEQKDELEKSYVEDEIDRLKDELGELDQKAGYVCATQPPPVGPGNIDIESEEDKAVRAAIEEECRGLWRQEIRKRYIEIREIKEYVENRPESEPVSGNNQVEPGEKGEEVEEVEEEVEEEVKEEVREEVKEEVKEEAKEETEKGEGEKSSVDWTGTSKKEIADSFSTQKNLSKNLNWQIEGIEEDPLPEKQEEKIGKTAYLFIDTGLSDYQTTWVGNEMADVEKHYESLGYKVIWAQATASEFEKAFTDPNIDAGGFFGHRSSPGIGDYDADTLQNLIRVAKYKKYRQTMSKEDALARVEVEIENFGLSYFHNHSCHSKDNDSIMDLLVKKGGVYWGEKGKLWGWQRPEKYIRE